MIERLSRVAPLGTTFVLCILFGLAVWIIAKAIERWSFFRARSDDLDGIGDELVSRLRRGDFVGADLVLGRSPSIEAALVRPALDWLDGGPGAVEAVLDAKRIGSRRDLQQSLLSLAVISRQAPWIGVFGMIVGLVDTFRVLEQEHGADTMHTLSHGVFIALVPAGAGVLVGLGAGILHGILINRARIVDKNAAILSKQLLAILRFKKKLAAEFGLGASGFGNDEEGSSEAELEDDADRHRPLSMAELD